MVWVVSRVPPAQAPAGSMASVGSKDKQSAADVPTAPEAVRPAAASVGVLAIHGAAD
jgi:hypothetical protein